jgi:phosphonoacetaldehyde hydrolase
VNRKLEAVIFDWAGTTVDYGSLAPVRVLVQVFSANGIPVSDQQARRDMGVPKRDHIEHILNSPDVARQWTLRHGRPPSCDDVDRLFAEFNPLQIKCLAEYSRLIPGTEELAARLRRHGIKIGSTTAACVKIGDTPADIAEGRNAGMWTVAVAATGNEIGLSEEQFAALTGVDQKHRLATARDSLLQAGAHYVVDSIAQCEGILDEIEHKLGNGERP